MCGHRLSAHSPAHRFACGTAGCECARYDFWVQQNAWGTVCECKHKHTAHTAAAPRRCIKPKCGCGGFHSTFECNCGHGWAEHTTEFVRASYPRHGREWVVQGLSPAMVAKAMRFRARSEEEQAALRERQAIAHAHGFKSMKEMQAAVAAAGDGGAPHRPGSGKLTES